MTSGPGKRTAALRLLLVLLGSGVGLALGTVVLWALRKPVQRIAPSDFAALRAKLDENPKALYEFDEATSYRFKPSFKGFRPNATNLVHETNARGLLGSAEVSSSPDIKRILFLGDSVTFGELVAFDRIFVSRMQTLAGASFQLLNAGVPGWSTHQEFQFYETRLKDIPLAAIVVCFCLNDLVQYEWVYADEEGFKLSAEATDSGGLWGMASSAEGLKLLATRKRLGADKKTAPLCSLNNSVLRAWDPDAWKGYREKVFLPWMTHEDHPPVIIVALPTKAQIQALALGAPRDEVLFPQMRMAELCAQVRAAFIDPLDAFQRSGSIQDADGLFSLDGLHLSEKGHEVLANYLWPRFQESSRHASAE